MSVLFLPPKIHSERKELATVGANSFLEELTFLEGFHHGGK